MKQITLTELSRFVYFANHSSYDYHNKEEYRKLGRRILKSIAEQMGLAKGEFDIRWNPGGIAVSGDHTLHTDKVYLHLSGELSWFYWRTCKGRKDYTGGHNQNVSWTALFRGGLAPLVAVLKMAQKGSVMEPNGDENFNIANHINMAMRALRA